jgi:[ribosomal protein S18]-alanine N-acetyltransferase
MTIDIRPMTLAHLDAVLEIERAAAPHPWTRGIFTDELAHADTRVYRVAVSDTELDAEVDADRDPEGEVVGFGGVLIQVGEAHITNVAVRESHRRRGIARMLMVELLARAIDRDAIAATLEVRVSNTAAQRMYHRFGFVPAGVRPRYYPDGEDAVIMWADGITSDEYASRLHRLAGQPSHEEAL